MIGDEALNDEIRRLVEEGWALTSQADATAGMSRDGLVIFLELQTDGTVRISGTGKDLARRETLTSDSDAESNVVEPEIVEPGMTMREAIHRYEENGWQLLSRASMTSAYFSRSTLAGNETATLELDGGVFNHTSGINIPGQNEAQDQTPADLLTYVRYLVSDGWVLNHQTRTTASLTRSGSRDIDGCLMVFLLFCFLIPGLIYLFWPRDDLSVILEESGGRILVSGTGADSANTTLRAFLRDDEYTDSDESKAYKLGKAVSGRWTLPEYQQPPSPNSQGVAKRQITLEEILIVAGALVIAAILVGAILA